MLVGGERKQQCVGRYDLNVCWIKFCFGIKHFVFSFILFMRPK